MKNIIVSIGLLLSLSAGAQDVVKIKGTRLVYPLMRKWINEVTREHPNVKIKISPNAPSDSIDFSIASYALTSNELKDDIQGVAVARYVQLPIVNANRPDLAEIKSKGITESTLKALFFGEQPVSLGTNSSTSPLQLYVRDRPVCAVKAFAKHFDENPTDLNGKAVSGDDEDLSRAVRGDVNGITFNNLGFIYDIKSRRVSSGLAIVPLDLNADGRIDKKEDIYETLDGVIEFIESTENPAFVNERVNLLYHQTNQKEEAKLFLNWILSNGQSFNHEYGFLLMDAALLNKQKSIAAGK